MPNEYGRSAHPYPYTTAPRARRATRENSLLHLQRPRPRRRIDQHRHFAYECVTALPRGRHPLYHLIAGTNLPHRCSLLAPPHHRRKEVFLRSALFTRLPLCRLCHERRRVRTPRCRAPYEHGTRSGARCELRRARGLSCFASVRHCDFFTQFLTFSYTSVVFFPFPFSRTFLETSRECVVRVCGCV